MASDDSSDSSRGSVSDSQLQSATAGGAASFGIPATSSAPATPWVSLAGAVGGVAGATAVVYAVGGAVMLMRLNGAGVEANQALGAIPQQTLFAVGADQLLLPAIVAASLYAFFLLLDRHFKKKAEARESAQEDEGETAPDDPVDRIEGGGESPPMPDGQTKSPDTPGRGHRFFSWLGHRLVRARQSRFGQISKRVLRWLLAPLRWYFRYVPDILLGWIPLFIFLSNPGERVMTFIAATGGAGIVGWAEQTSTTRREFALRSALALALLTTGIGLGDELIHPHELPKVAIETVKGTNETAKFVAVSGGNAYVVKDEKLAILPSSSYTELTVTGTETKPPHEESIFNRLWP